MEKKKHIHKLKQHGMQGFIEVTSHCKNAHLQYDNYRTGITQMCWMRTWICRRELHMKVFNTHVMVFIKLYGDEYLSKPTPNSIQFLYDAHETKYEFAWILSSIDCTYWNWMNYLTKLRIYYMRGDHEYLIMILKVIVLQYLWFYHAYYSFTSLNTNFNVIN